MYVLGSTVSYILFSASLEKQVTKFSNEFFSLLLIQYSSSNPHTFLQYLASNTSAFFKHYTNIPLVCLHCSFSILPRPTSICEVLSQFSLNFNPVKVISYILLWSLCAAQMKWKQCCQQIKYPVFFKCFNRIILYLLIKEQGEVYNNSSR